MSRGTPDGGYQSYNGATVNQSDLGSVADRLLMGGGSITRTGRVIWASGFEGVSTFADFNASGAGALVTAGSVNAPAWQGANFMALQTQAVLNDAAGMFKYFPASIQTGRWGVESMICLGYVAGGSQGALSTTFDIIVKKVGAPSPNPTVLGKIRFAIGASNASIILQYMNSSGVFVQLDDLSNTMAINTGAYYNIKLVTDFGANKYTRFILNNKIYDLSAQGMQISGTGVDEKSSFQFVNTTTDATAKLAGVDNVILTSDEV